MDINKDQKCIEGMVNSVSSFDGFLGINPLSLGLYASVYGKKINENRTNNMISIIKFNLYKIY